MKNIKIEKTKISEDKVKFQGDKDKELDYKDLLEIAMDVLPQGGFTPKDIRERNRIQDALDQAKDGKISLEDADYEALIKIVNNSRWTLRDKELHKFLSQFVKE